MLSPAQQSPCEAAFTPLGAQVAVHELADVAEVPRQKRAELQHWLASVQPTPAPRHEGTPQVPLLQSSPVAQSPLSIQRWPELPGVGWQVVGAPAVAPRQ